MSDAQRYKQMGNAVTTNVIAAVASKLVPCTNEKSEMYRVQICKNCGHSKELHVTDSFGNPVCDKVTKYKDGIYDFECDCKSFELDCSLNLKTTERAAYCTCGKKLNQETYKCDCGEEYEKTDNLKTTENKNG